MTLALHPGERHNKLTALHPVPERMQDGRVSARWACECGGERVAPIGRVRAGIITSCGCDRIERLRAARTVHGGRYSAEYRTWKGIKYRCTNPRSKDYARYGGAGVTVCERWADSFAAFLADVGPRPFKNAQIDRVDTTKGYAPGNVRWVTAKVNSSNRRSSYVWRIKGLTFESAQAAADHFGVSDATIHRWCAGGNRTRARHDCSKTKRYGHDHS